MLSLFINAMCVSGSHSYIWTQIWMSWVSCNRTYWNRRHSIRMSSSSKIILQATLPVSWRNTVSVDINSLHSALRLCFVDSLLYPLCCSQSEDLELWLLMCLFLFTSKIVRANNPRRPKSRSGFGTGLAAREGSCQVHYFIGCYICPLHIYHCVLPYVSQADCRQPRHFSRLSTP